MQALPAIQAWDTRVLYWVNGHHHPVMDAVLYPISAAGEYAGLLILLFYAVLFDGIPRTRWRDWLPYGIIVLLANRILFEWVTILGFRERPYLVLDGVRQIGQPWITSSFPSGHAHYAWLVTVVLGAHHPKWLWVLVPFTLLTCYARPYLGMHYPSDVITGSLFGIVFGFLVLAAQRTWLRRKMPPAPLSPVPPATVRR